jgi:hypothetical protein
MAVSNAGTRSVTSSVSAKYNNLVLRKTSTDGATYTLTTDGQTAGQLNQIVLSDDSTYAFTLLVVARRADTDTENAGWEFKGVAIRNTNAASTSILGVSKSLLYKTTSTWDCNVAVDTVNGGLSVTCNGDAAKTIKWVVSVNIAEVTG